MTLHVVQGSFFIEYTFTQLELYMSCKGDTFTSAIFTQLGLYMSYKLKGDTLTRSMIGQLLTVTEFIQIDISLIIF